MSLIAAREAAAKWNISQRRVAILCSEGRIPGAVRVGNMWIIPEHAPKPVDGRTTRFLEKNKPLKPFVKWAGGKSQLLPKIRKSYPEGMGITITKYAEPFLGGGAVLFDILSTYQMEEVYVSDINKELINTYQIIRDDVTGLIKLLTQYQNEYVPADNEKRKLYYYKQRDRFNELISNNLFASSVEGAALFIFLNKTCFNGLYRVNRKGLFNVPMGAYKNPLICDADNLRNASKALQNVTIACADYRNASDFIDERTFVYFDPPYRPLTETSNFTSYTEQLFGDDAQKELAHFVSLMHNKKAKIVVSNSDPKNADASDDFFDTLYAEHRIRRVEATRMINSNSAARGKINELLICNF